MAADNVLIRFFNTVFNVIDTPAAYFREKIVLPNQKKYPWYHQKYRRVPNIDECYTHDIVCYTEANIQFKRDKLVDDEILYILRSRFEECAWYHGSDDMNLCDDIRKTYEDASTAWFMKYGDMGVTLNVKDAYMKQKHRMIWERRHGPVGSGMKEDYKKA
ncbi:NADH dehydrogenase [ubiquinone] 1 beta subcomplex subunit 10 [Harpegnathos saltator]|uniref:NADH dehydrogenase [ubiquinone] 1 beta subcomplex subunit 10 n=1 Tax=Harpegnathos saltator TaxID=610380 RepID=E2BMC3_HARSA|nr:NADH dehydrogenase [ubiquinone] 1 beta subcomplex subunit 10 [Harpegnathos saltator]EFN83152.1 NADH dehydrogenase [ubiquinone] 1 beta subcomplex subunit 10 [Harpegnathos saltator]